MIQVRTDVDLTTQAKYLDFPDGMMLSVWIPPGTRLPAPIPIPSTVLVQHIPHANIVRGPARETPAPARTWWQRLFSL